MLVWLKQYFYKKFTACKASSLKTIPSRIDYETPSEAAVCLHEAGHATAALMVGLAPELMELIDDAESRGLARSRIPIGNQEQRETIACAAFAVEFLLFRENRLGNAQGMPLQEGAFIQISLGSNAAQDKVNFFGANYEQQDLRWPKPYDEAFMHRGIGLAPKLNMSLVIELAEALLNARRLHCAEIIEIAAKHLPGMASVWRCPNDGQDNS